jgi:hypothetical protein
MRDDEQHAMWSHCCSKSAKHHLPLGAGEMHEVRLDEIVFRRRRLPHEDVRLEPLDMSGPVVRTSSLQRNGSDVRRRHLPSSLREPDRVRAVAATDVQCATGLQTLYCIDDATIGFARPGRVAR